MQGIMTRLKYDMVAAHTKAVCSLGFKSLLCQWCTCAINLAIILSVVIKVALNKSVDVYSNDADSYEVGYSN